MLISPLLELTLLVCRVAFLLSIALALTYFIIALVHLIWLKCLVLKKNWINFQKTQQIPCYFCIFCTGEESLKCTVQPDIALSKKAIGCEDYQPIQRQMKSQS